MALFSSAVASAEENTPAFVDSSSHEVLLADPTVYRLGDRYYMAGTQPGQPQGFTVLVSDDLTHWSSTSPDRLPQLTPGADIYGTKGFWAPQFLPVGDKIYMLYTANEQVACAVADSITGKYHAFVPKGEDAAAFKPAPIDPSAGNIDPFLFRDRDGKYYLYHVRFDNGNYLWVGEYDIEKGKIVEGTLQPTFRVDQPWEHTRSYDSVPIMEGPTVVLIGDTYYLFYSANHFMSKDYAVGYATAPTPLGPWTKNPYNPIINTSLIGELGSGHGDVFTDTDGQLRYVFHTHYSADQVSPRRTRIVSLKVLPSEMAGAPARIVADPSTIIYPIVATADAPDKITTDPTAQRHEYK